MSESNGKPANSIKPSRDMTLREYIATAAVQGFLASGRFNLNRGAKSPEEDMAFLADEAVQMADALLKSLSEE